MKHLNAREVFTPVLVKQIQKYYSGGYLWIPDQGNEDRNEKIRALYENGKSIKDIVRKTNLTKRWIRQIIAKRIQQN